MSAAPWSTIPQLVTDASNRFRDTEGISDCTTSRPFGELADATKTRQSVVSQHLALLRAHKVVSTRREGTSIFYSIEDHAARAMIETLHRIY